ncbi:hypothetical protein IHE49_04160 [Rhodanobacter sp. 7MK24]|uniref:hypothetical protein n=1 Tax=Rhodanobacter sp. 7MK24 TaxID=2775922 RepID=UPI00177FBB2B|nr:hypothetical protein [Rhodanobacter sp. 7MK24]MBD8879670.1 hypothetical protein [Rhodanobacter sp. 7MK24]
MRVDAGGALMRMPDLRSAVDRHALSACLLFGAIGALLLRQDASWDLRNYHLYNVWALLHGRLTIDLAAAGLQSYFNPLLDLPYYLLGMGPLAHLPRLLAALQGLWYGGMVFVLLRIAMRLADLQGRAFGAGDLFAVLIGATGTMTVSQVGLSSNEMPLAMLVLLAVYLLLPLCAEDPVERAAQRVLLAGLLCGLAAGLKPTAIVYSPALACALLVACVGRAGTWRLCLLFVAAASGGFLAVYGWWGVKLWSLTGNPVFPMFNQVFHSAWLPPVSGTDIRFLPKTAGQWLFYPCYWVFKNQWLVTETRFADPRYALAMAALAVLAASAWFRRKQAAAGGRALRLLAVFVVLAYVAWLRLFSILRYVIPLEALTGLLLLLAIQALLAVAGKGRSSRSWLAWCMAGIFLMSVYCSHYPSWGRADYADTVFNVRAPAVEPGSTVLLIGQPLAYIIPFIGNAESSQFIGLTSFNQHAGNYRLNALVRERLHSHQGPIYALLESNVASGAEALQQWLPGAQFAGQCEVVSSNLHNRRYDDANLRLCRVLQH